MFQVLYEKSSITSPDDADAKVQERLRIHKMCSLQGLALRYII